MGNAETVSYSVPTGPPAASQNLDHLLSPLQIGDLTLRNRVFSSGHGTGFANGGVTDQLIAYHAERARGGTALIITEATSIDPMANVGVSPTMSGLRNVDDSIIPGYVRLSEALHAEGAAVMAMLAHSGRNNTMGIDGDPPRAPSPLPMDRTRDIPHELEHDEITAIVHGFAAGARRSKEGGLDGVELSFAHGNLVQSFMSPASNRRTDKYGGSVENRLRFAREVLEAVREAVGDSFPVGIRFSLDEVVSDGYRADEALDWLPLMVEWGRLDFVDISAGTNASMLSRSLHYPTITVPPATLVPLSRAAKKVVDVPVFCVGKIYDPFVADAIVASGGADMVAMTRAQLAEPELVNKAAAKRFDEIRTCIYCNEGCFSRQQRVGPITCVYNPRVGRESIWPPITRAEIAKRVVVIGGGPAGMEAARVAAKAGHRVTLLERDPELGGQLRLIVRAPHRADYGTILRWYLDQLKRYEVDVRLNTHADVALVSSLKPDAVIVATGSTDELQDVPGRDQPHVFSGRQVLAGAEVTGSVVIGDWDGRWAGLSVAEYLADRGHDVTIVTPAPFPGVDGDLLTWHPYYARLLRKSVVMRSLEEIVEITARGAMVARMDGQRRELAADCVVLVNKGAADRELWRQLRSSFDTLSAVGDCWAPRQLEQAIFEGARAARAL